MKKKDNVEKPCPDGYKTKKEEKVKKEELENLPKEVKEKLEAVWKENEEIKKAHEELIEKQKKVEDENKKKDFIAKAEKEYTCFGKPEEFGLVLKEISEKAPESYEKLETVLKSAEEQIKAGKTFDEKGTNTPNTSGNSFDKIQKCAEKIAKDENISIEKAVMVAMEKNPELYTEYSKEENQL